MKAWQIVALISIAVIGVVYLIAPRSDVAPLMPRGDDAPWGVHAVAGGRHSRVFGLTLGTAHLSEAMARFGREPKLALFDTPGKGLSLEVFYEEVTLAGLSGRIILSLAAPTKVLEAMRARAVDRKPMDSGAIRYTLAQADLRAASGLTVAGLTYIPYADLNADIVTQRFGKPAERLRTRDGLVHWLYPALGLDIALNPAGRDVLQYVAPADFARLLAPLERAETDQRARPGTDKTPGNAASSK